MDMGLVGIGDGGGGSIWSSIFDFSMVDYYMHVHFPTVVIIFSILLSFSSVYFLEQFGAVCYFIRGPLYLLRVLLHGVICCMAIIDWLDGDVFFPDVHAYFRNSAHQCPVDDVVFSVRTGVGGDATRLINEKVLRLPPLDVDAVFDVVDALVAELVFGLAAKRFGAIRKYKPLRPQAPSGSVVPSC